MNNLFNTGSNSFSLSVFKIDKSLTLSIEFLITLITINYAYPFEAVHFQLWSFVGIGISAFFLALERNKEPLKGSFIGSIFMKAVPGAIATLLPVGLIYLTYALQQNGVLFTGIYDIEVAAFMSVLAFNFMSLIILLKICLPFSKYRACVFAGAATLEVGLVTLAAVLSYHNHITESIIAINFQELTLVNWFVLGIIVILVSALYLIVTYIIEVFKGEHLNDKN